MPDELPIIYFLDEQEDQRHFMRTSLLVLFADLYEVKALPVLSRKEDYLPLLDAGDVAAVFVDQQLDQTGEITTFTGVQLSETLRQHFPEMPIYVVTGHVIGDELTSEPAGATDAVISKSDLVIGDPRSFVFKRQFLRKAGQYDKALTSKQKRFRELLAQRIKGDISAEDAAELDILETSRLIPIASAESSMQKQVDTQVAELGDLLSKVEQLINEK